jgi:hypothetical protein
MQMALTRYITEMGMGVDVHGGVPDGNIYYLDPGHSQ